jgi:hypothetical protein
MNLLSLPGASSSLKSGKLSSGPEEQIFLFRLLEFPSLLCVKRLLPLQFGNPGPEPRGLRRRNGRHGTGSNVSMNLSAGDAEITTRKKGPGFCSHEKGGNDPC